jgi:hypothetical protein
MRGRGGGAQVAPRGRSGTSDRGDAMRGEDGGAVIDRNGAARADLDHLSLRDLGLNAKGRDPTKSANEDTDAAPRKP